MINFFYFRKFFWWRSQAQYVCVWENCQFLFAAVFHCFDLYLAYLRPQALHNLVNINVMMSQYYNHLSYVLLPSGPLLHSGLLFVRHLAQILTVFAVSALLYLFGIMSDILDMDDCNDCCSTNFLLLSTVCWGDLSFCCIRNFWNNEVPVKVVPVVVGVFGLEPVEGEAVVIKGKEGVLLILRCW